MVNEDIVTALKNAIKRGEPLESAIETAISSGYNPRDVEEASKFVGEGALTNIEQVKPEESLLMPAKKGFFSEIFGTKPKKTFQPLQTKELKPVQKKTFQPELNPIEQPYPKSQSVQQSTFQAQPQPAPQPKSQSVQQPTFQTMSQLAIQPKPRPVPQISQIQTQKTFSYPVQRPAPRRSYIKEIILLIFLLILVGILILTVRFREQIILFFSG